MEDGLAGQPYGWISRASRDIVDAAAFGICNRSTMSGKYAFTKGLKEVRFLFCQSSDHSAATRYVSELTQSYEVVRLTQLGRSSFELILR